MRCVPFIGEDLSLVKRPPPLPCISASSAMQIAKATQKAIIVGDPSGRDEI